MSASKRRRRTRTRRLDLSRLRSLSHDLEDVYWTAHEAQAQLPKLSSGSVASGPTTSDRNVPDPTGDAVADPRLDSIRTALRGTERAAAHAETELGFHLKRLLRSLEALTFDSEEPIRTPSRSVTPDELVRLKEAQRRRESAPS